MSNAVSNSLSESRNIELFFAAQLKYRLGDSAPAYTRESAGILSYALSGSCTYCANGINYPLKAGEIIWLPPGIETSVLTVEEPLVLLRSFRISVHDPLLYKRLQCFFLPIKVDSTLNDMLNYMYDNWRDRSKDNTEIISAFSYSILNLFLLNQNRITTRESTFVLADKFSPATQKLLLFLESHGTTGYSLDEMSKMLCYNPNYLSSVFSKDTGFSIHDYFNFIRIRLSIINFFFWMRNISVVSSHLKFNSISHFSRVFKKYVGIPPKEFYNACCSLSAEERTMIVNTEPILSYRSMPINELFDSLLHIGNTMKNISIEKGGSTTN